MATEALDVVIVGGGHAGLGTAYELQRQCPSAKVVVLEGSHSVGSTWTKRYARLHLHTPKSTSYLPGFPFPRDYPTYPSAAQVQAHLQKYVEVYKLPVRLGHHVQSIQHNPGTQLYTIQVKVWQAQPAVVNSGGPGGYHAPEGSTQSKALTARCVVLATGAESVPRVPTFPGQELFKGTVLHSTQYKDGAPFKGKKVLVVGCGNSGGEIALCLWEHGAQSTLLVRKRRNMVIMKPDDGMLTSLLQHFDIKNTLKPYIKLLDQLGGVVTYLQAPKMHSLGWPQIMPGWFGSPGVFSTINSTMASPFQDLGTCDKIKKGEIKSLRGEMRGFTAQGVLVAPPAGDDPTQWGPEEEHTFDAVVLCTGYDVSGSFKNLLSPDLLSKVLPPGASRPVSGQETAQPGLFALGWEDMFGRICMMRQEAKAVAEGIRARLGLNK